MTLRLEKYIEWSLCGRNHAVTFIDYNWHVFSIASVCWCFCVAFPPGAFVICWTPGLVVLLLDGLHCTQCHVTSFKRWLLLLAVLNSVMNPIIYSYKDEEMWLTFKNLLRCICTGTRRQRSSRANIRPGMQETGSSLHTSEENKSSVHEMLKDWSCLLQN